MRRLATFLISALGIAALLLGLLFIVGSAGRAQRLLVGGVFLISGAGMVGLGVRRVKNDKANSPERLRSEILALAKREEGEISSDEVTALAGDRHTTALAVIEAMILEGTCRRSERSGSPLYVFPDLQPRLTVLRCEYCATEQPLNSDPGRCPKCGGPLVKKIVARSLTEGEVFSMDEQSP